ncbi:MAG: glycosyltransferase WbuB, partial [Muribaculaceae bacterium]
TVYLLGRYPLEYMATFFNKADCMLVSLKDELAFNLVLPAKIQAYMSCSKPIIGMINGETAQIIEKSKCGLYCDANDIESMFDLITQMSKYKIEKLNTLGNNGYQYYLNHFEKNMCMYKLNKILAQFI